jgi:hypothetical protein
MNYCNVVNATFLTLLAYWVLQHLLATSGKSLAMFHLCVCMNSKRKSQSGLRSQTMGKGSAPRPIPNPDKFRENWDQIFGKKKEEKEKK